MRPPLAANQSILLDGFFTQVKYLKHQTYPQVERRLGLAPGRLARGWWLLFLEQMPSPADFEFMGYSHMSGGVVQGHLRPGRMTAEQELVSRNYDVFGLKQRTIRQTFSLSGPDQLAKVVPVNSPSGSMPYPPGSGVPQWKLINALSFRVWGLVGPGQIYSGN